jgi:hypothetical protein
VITLPRARLRDVLGRIDEAWQPWISNNMLVLALSGAGKTTLLRVILAELCPDARVVIFLPKLSPDSTWLAEPHPPMIWPRRLPARFGLEGDAGGPEGRWYLRLAAADNKQAEADFRADIQLILNEGHALVVFDDVRTLASTYHLRDDIGDVICNGRSLGISTITASQTAGYVPARDQMSAQLIGYLGNLDAAKAAAPLISKRGRDWQDTLNATERYEWIYHDKHLGDAGPCRVQVPPL